MVVYYKFKMNKKRIANKVVKKCGGIARTQDFVKEGLSPLDVASLCKSGYLKRIKRGYYNLTNEIFIDEAQMIKALLPDAILCVEYTLFYYGYSDFTPRGWFVAVPRDFSRSRLKIENLHVNPYFIQPELLSLGCVENDVNGFLLKMYDRERTICDLFKYKSRIDSETFNKAVKRYARDNKKNLANLSEYSRALGVHEKMKDIMEVLLND